MTQLLAGGKQPVTGVDLATEFLSKGVQRCFRGDASGTYWIKADNAGPPPFTVIDCQWVNSSQFAGPPMLVPLPEAPTRARVRELSSRGFLPRRGSIALSSPHRQACLTMSRSRRAARRGCDSVSSVWGLSP
jgi:hypothetical protein